MTKDECRIHVKRLADYFNVKITTQQLDSYYEQLYFIEYQTFQEIVSRIISDRKPFKSMFPTVTEIMPIYESEKYKNTDFDPMEFEGENCSECGGYGLLWFKYWNHSLGRVYESHVICAKCRNWQKHYNKIEPHGIFIDGKFRAKFNGIRSATKTELENEQDVVDIRTAEGCWKLSKSELTDKIIQNYGGN